MIRVLLSSSFSFALCWCVLGVCFQWTAFCVWSMVFQVLTSVSTEMYNIIAHEAKTTMGICAYVRVRNLAGFMHE